MNINPERGRQVINWYSLSGSMSEMELELKQHGASNDELWDFYLFWLWTLQGKPKDLCADIARTLRALKIGKNARTASLALGKASPAYLAWLGGGGEP